MTSDKVDEMSQKLRELVQSSGNMQEFVDLASPEENWEKVDKNIVLPKHIGFAVEECPSCFEEIRLIYDKFAGCDLEFPLICPHCSENILCLSEFTGHTNELYLEQ